MNVVKDLPPGAPRIHDIFARFGKLLADNENVTLSDETRQRLDDAALEVAEIARDTFRFSLFMNAPIS